MTISLNQTDTRPESSTGALGASPRVSLVGNTGSAPWGALGPSLYPEIGLGDGDTNPAYCDPNTLCLAYNGDNPMIDQVPPTTQVLAQRVNTLLGQGAEGQRQLVALLESLNARQKTDLINAVVTGLNDDQRQAIRRTIAHRRGLTADSTQITNFDIFYQHLVNTMGRRGHDIWLNHVVNGITHPDGGNFQARVLYQWLVRDRAEYERHPQRNGDYVVVQGQREAIRNFVGRLGIRNQGQMEDVETPQTRPFFNFCNGSWTDTFRNHLPAVGQLPSYLVQNRVFQNTSHDTLAYRGVESPTGPTGPVQVAGGTGTTGATGRTGASGAAATPQEFAQQATTLLSQGASSRQQMIALLGRMNGEQRAQFIQAFAGIAGNRREGEADLNAYNLFWKRLSEAYGPLASQVWNNHVITGIPNFQNQMNDIARQVAPLAIMDIAENTPDLLRNRLRDLNPQVRTAVIQQLAQQLRRTNNERYRGLNDRATVYRAMVDSFGTAAYDIWLNYMTPGMLTADGQDYQTQVMHQWLVQDQTDYDNHPSRNGTFTIIQGKRVAIRNFLERLGVRNREQLNAVETPQTAPFFHYCNNVWTPIFRNRIPAVGQLPSYLINRENRRDIFADTTVQQLSYRPPQPPPPPPRPELVQPRMMHFTRPTAMMCHDTGQGPGAGFRLNLQGYDPTFDPRNLLPGNRNNPNLDDLRRWLENGGPAPFRPQPLPCQDNMP